MLKKGTVAGSITTTATAVSLAAYPHGGAFHPYTKPLDGAPTNLQPRLSAPLRRLTSYINDSYRICNPGFRYMSSLNPRRVLTKPAQGVHNQNYDNANFDLILYVNDILGLQTKNRYVVLDLLGQGTFGQVVKCRKQDTGEIVAVKVVKNRPAYFNQGMFEVHILEVLNSRYNGDQHNIVQMVDSFMDRGHLCLVFELLSVNLFELIAQNQYKGLSTNLIRIFLRQILKALVVLEECGIIHCDLKPENILLRNTTTPHIKLIDFGSACYGHQTVYTYIQSRFYRSPEVLIGHPYTTSIDMWSLGCMAAELFLGIPLFPGHNEYNQLARIVEMQGDIPQHLLERGKFTPKFYNAIPIDSARFHFQMKSKEQWSEENNTKPRPTKRYFPADKRLGEIIQAYPCKKGITPQALDQEKRARVAFVDFIEGLLQIDPNERWTAEQAGQHPFVTGQPFTGPWTPPPRKPVTPLIAPPPFGPGVGPTARSPPALAPATASEPQLSSSLPPASLAINPPTAGQRRPGPLPMTTGGPPPPMGLPGGTGGGVGPVYSLVAAEKNAALGRRGSLPVAHDLSAMMPSGVPLMAGGGYPPPLPHGFGGPPPPYPPPGMQLQGPPPGHPASAGGNPRGGAQQQRPRGQQQQPQYPSPPSASSHIQRSPRSMPNMAPSGAYGQQPLMQAQHGQRGGGVPPGYADLIPSASVTLSTSPTTTATTTSSLPSSPKSSSALAADPAVAYYYDSSTYPPPEHGNAAGRGKPTLGPFQKQLDARNQHRRRSVSMDPKRQGLPKQRTQTAAAISAAAGEISAGGGGGVGGSGSGGKGKGSQRMTKGTQQGGGRGAFAADEPKGRGGAKAQDAKGHMQRAGSADGGEETTKGGGSGRGSGRRQRSVSNMEPVERNGSHNGDTHSSESPVGSPTSEMERLSLDGSSPESFIPSPSDTFNAALSSLTSTSSSSFSSSFALSSSAASATRSPKGPARQPNSSSSSSSSTSSSSHTSSSSSSSSSFSSTTSSATLGLSPESNARKRSPRSPRKQLPSSKLGGGGGAGGNLNGPSSLPLSSMSTAGASSSSLSARSRPPVSPRNKQPQTPQKGKARERSPPRTRAVIPPHHQMHPSPNHSNQAAVQSEDDGWDSRATEDLMFDEGSPYASSPTGMKSPPGAELGGGAVSNGSNSERAGVDMRQSNPISIAGGGGSYTGGRGFYAAQPSDASWSEWSTLQAPKFSLESSYGAKPPFPSAVGAGSSFSDSASSAIFGFSPSSMPSQGFFYSQPFPPHQQQGQPSFQPSTSNPSGMDPRYLGGPPPIVGTPLMGMVHSSFEVGTPGAGRGGPDDWASSSPRHPHHYQQHQHQHQQAYSSPYTARHPPQHHPHHPPSSSSSSSSAPPPVGGIRPPPASSAGED
ncbi:protein kinase domain containing protein [Acanthamoeba castellanii str. Neff]|uniref:Protein kinase domain containing protein n=1 Tax=Acanthamoeba castellanii (strain ATCC 30010 / Neff) TaxID=1257118 RepID=L8GPB8_ACACF|nr:protein kinase domain containing protein [Acanthamoeba castellanii str. Neff]ELR13981.1 protein kinase domain containing protein [Acanthamoeba castellanii str. Neff]